jgi:hypothetical protein
MTRRLEPGRTTWRGAPLEPAARGFLERHLEEEFGDVRCHRGALARWLCRRLGAGAVTLGRRVFLSPGGWRRYRQGGASGLALLAHEAVHVLQYRRYGFFGMLARYGRDYLRGRRAGLSHGEAYRAVGFEREAFAVEARVRDAVLARERRGGAVDSGA